MTNADLPLYQGDTFDAVVNVTNSDGTPADLTGAIARSQIRRNVADQDTAIAVEIETLIILPNRVFLKIPATKTRTLSGKYVWDLQLQLPGNDDAVVTVIAGKVSVTQEVTRDTSIAVVGGAINARRPVAAYR